MTRWNGGFPARALVRQCAFALLAFYAAVSGPYPQAWSRVDRHSSKLLEHPASHQADFKALRTAAGDGQGLPGTIGQNLGGNLGKFNPLSPKEPIIVDPNRAYPTTLSLPGPLFAPAAYSTDSMVAQLAHSSDGIVRLPPGDYSIPVHLY